MKRIILSVLLLLPLIGISQTELRIKDTIFSEMSSKEKHNYSLYLEADQLVLLSLNQIGIDLEIITFDLDGKKVASFDSPNGRFGPETFLISSDKKGYYSIEVRSIDSNEVTGKYKLHIEKVVPKDTTIFGKVDQIFMPWDNSETPGAAVSIIQNGKIVYQKAFGIANLEYNIPNQTSTKFITGSIAKQFTAFSIVLLEKENKLSLDDDIRKYIPEVPDFGYTITLRHLANHTSGLREEAVLAALMGWNESDVVTTDQILKVIAKQKALNFKPGEQYMYCNTGYTLLAEVVSRVSGQSFVEFTQERIFIPLKMNHSQFFDDYQKIIKNRAYSYYASGNGYKKNIINDANPGSSGLLTTIEDLSLWVLNFENQTVGDVEIFHKMETLGILNNGETTNYGLGTEQSNYKGLTEIGHGGAIGGFRARIARFPEQDFAVIVLANNPAVHPVAIPNQIIDIFLKDDFMPKKENKQNHKIETTTKKIERFKPSKEVLSSLLGTYYSNELLTEYEILLKDDKLIITHPRLQIDLTALSEDTFIVDGWADAEIQFRRDMNNDIVGFSFSMINVKNIVFDKE